MRHKGKLQRFYFNPAKWRDSRGTRLCPLTTPSSPVPHSGPGTAAGSPQDQLTAGRRPLHSKKLRLTASRDLRASASTCRAGRACALHPLRKRRYRTAPPNGKSADPPDRVTRPQRRLLAARGGAATRSFSAGLCPPWGSRCWPELRGVSPQPGWRRPFAPPTELPVLLAFPARCPSPLRVPFPAALEDSSRCPRGGAAELVRHRCRFCAA